MSKGYLTHEEIATIADIGTQFNAIGGLKFSAYQQIETELRLGNKEKAQEIFNNFLIKLQERLALISSDLQR